MSSAVQAAVDAQAQRVTVESRWPAIVALLVILGLLALLPGRFRVTPEWVPISVIALTIAPMLAVMAFRTQRWLRIEKVVILCFIAVTIVLMSISLSALISSIIGRAGEITGLTLLASAIAIWAGNIVLFAFIFWSTDGGGPEARISGNASDWYFPQQGLQERFPDWLPLFVDYLYLAYETATAFSSTDDAPLTRKAKFLMMAESAVSLITLVIVAARAINVLK